MANFLYEACLHWNRVPNEELANCWLRRVMKFTPRVIKAGFDDFMESEAYFPVPGTVFPYFQYIKGDPTRPRVGVYEPTVAPE